MLASLSDILAWKPSVSTTRKTTPRRAPTATSEGNSSDDVSETESAESSQCSASYQQHSGQCKARNDRQPRTERNTESSHPILSDIYSLARTTSSKLFLVKKSRQAPQTPPMTPTKPRFCSVNDTSLWDLPITTVGARVATSFGLGKVIAVRDEDGIAAIELQASGLLYLSAGEMKKVHVIPALVGEQVYTPSGSGCGGLCEYELQLRPSDVQVTDGSEPGRASEARRSRGISEGGNVDRESRRSSVRLSTASSANGLTMMKNIAATSYTFVASKYHQGQPVITKFGAGHIVSLDPQRGSAQIQLVWGATAFVTADVIDFYPKALEGTDVQTKFGSGIVIGLRPADAIYTVRLHNLQPAGKSNVVFVHGSDLHRSWRIAVTAANVRDKLKAMAHRRFGERIVVAQRSHDEEPNSAGI
ncbi:unnamed protein product [Peronospora destructor]|uniref:Altered inheritance of mitochondria protein 24, mitochondrial n=1 Tax=Peronospora destructor TaxID=86335 RepID=A0AAV0V500_9STRA|nr:unnamed protein product [Peronospora destructor]